MLKNDFYAGIVSFGDKRAESDRYPALWDAETFRKVQQQRQDRSRGGREPTSPVAGVAYCNRCGYSMHVCSYYADGDARFACTAHRRAYTGAFERCHPNTTKESVIIDFVDDLLSHLDMIEALMDIRATDGLEQQASEAAAEAERIREKQKRLALRVADGTIGVEAARAANDDLQAQLNAARATRDAALKEIRLQPNPDEVREQLEQLVGKSIRDLPLLQVRSYLKRAKVKVFIEDGKVVRASIG
jgi:hypothetical protein